MVDKRFCASSYLMFRSIVKEDVSFCEKYPSRLADISFERTPVTTAGELIDALKANVCSAAADGKAALALSGGADSAILARLMPPGSTAYTFRCVVPGIKVIDESKQAEECARACGLKHKIVDITWEDVEAVSPLLMRHKGAPIHSIETQIYLASCQARRDGFSKLIFGELADTIFGGLDGLLSKDWTYGEFIERYSYVMPYKVLREPELILTPYKEFEKNGYIDTHAFLNQYFRRESLGSYYNACSAAGIDFVGPYSKTKLGLPLDLARIRSGESKYLVREACRILLPDFQQPPKTPMPRPTAEWLKKWSGPHRKDFIPNCHISFSGDQKWMVYALEKFMDIIDEEV